MSNPQVRTSNEVQQITPRGSIQQSAALSGLCCVAAFVLLALANNVLNTAVFDLVATYAPYGREIAILFGAACFLGFYFLAARKPKWLSMRLFTAGAALSIALGTLLLEIAFPQQNAFFTVIGLMLERFGTVWGALLLALALVQLPSKRQMLLCAVWGMALGEIARAFIPVFSPGWGVVVESLCYVGIGILLYRMAAPVVSDLAKVEAPADVEVVNPESFLAPGNAVYLCVLVFNIALGFALTLNSGAFNPVTLGLTALVITCVAAWLSFGEASDREDELFSFCVLIAVAGFLVAPFTFLSGESTANTLLGIGARTFELLIWLAVLSVGRRNILALLPTFALLRAVSSLGTTLGAVAGHGATALVGEGTALAAFITDAALFVFVVILWLGFRHFSFSRVISGVATLPAALDGLSDAGENTPLSHNGERIRSAARAGEALELADFAPHDEGEPKTLSADSVDHAEDASETSQQIDLINQRCQELGKLHNLTPREIEIFALLARGRNGSFIMNHFVVSRNTAKSHIKHIYTKLGVHSQQELIDLVERG